MEKKIQEARLGYAKANIAKLEMKFGKHNPRAVDAVQVKLLKESMESYGRQRYTRDNTIRVMVKRDEVNVDELAKEYGHGADVYPVLQLKGEKVTVRM